MDIALALLLARLIGLGFAAHGAQKLFGWFGGHGIAGTAGWFESIGFRPGKAFAVSAGLGELAGGLLIVLGAGGPIGPMLVIASMVVAIVAVHRPFGFFAAGNGIELPLVWLTLGFVFAFSGFGAYSLDAALGIGGFWTPALDWAVVALGLIAGFANVAAQRKPAPRPEATA